MDNINKIVDELVVWLRDKVGEAGARGIVFGLSGGVDSAVMAGLAKRAFPKTSLGIIMPCHSDPIDEEHGLLVARSLDLKTRKVDLSESFDSLLKSSQLETRNKLAIANIKPRLRMTTLYYFAQSYNYLVVGSSNKSEFTVGYFTKHGDSGVDLLPLADFTKHEIWDLARFLELPKIVVDKPPTAGLWSNQTDEEDMGFSYELLDDYIETSIGQGEVYSKIDRMDRRSQHKRNYPPIFKRRNK